MYTIQVATTYRTTLPAQKPVLLGVRAITKAAMTMMPEPRLIDCGTIFSISDKPVTANIKSKAVNLRYDDPNDLECKVRRR